MAQPIRLQHLHKYTSRIPDTLVQCAHDEGARCAALQQPQNAVYTLGEWEKTVLLHGDLLPRGEWFLVLLSWTGNIIE